MSTEELIKASKARFNHNFQKQLLKQKYQSKLVFANQNGLWCATPDFLSKLQSFNTEYVILEDDYNNPVKVNRVELLNTATTLYHTVMEQWYNEYQTLKDKR